uniref:L1 transposable element RRM domain-containing protein n=1 Tax=Equus caballus TaxID=9796 RepID=A0A9L0SF19_HORSE
MEERISLLEDKNVKILQVEEETELRFFQNEGILQEISDSIRKSNIRIIGIPEGEGREKEAESLFKEIIAENFPNMGMVSDLQINEVNRMCNFINVKRPSPRHIIVKMAKVWDKQRILGAARYKKINYRGSPVRLSADFSAETSQARREWNNIFKILKDKNFQPRILLSSKTFPQIR